ncbi:HEPN domain-containing protein [Sphingomonas crocodyli]|uniref:HEPN domain-containing protein n=1 Tax=Sphingomonas crocodyli TaxID=1979270 RepID=A0A437LXW2_9SPHN|nr:HEPN domain-containing protein [Sphingomonas crocodyli]RVT90194.1 HEPN domain-containing protein [Sphingomonas crocodyli]
MRSDLDHLPADKQRELSKVVQILFEEFDDALAMAQGTWKRRGRIQKVILYGSYARGEWVDEPYTAKGYQSDFDLLVIVSDKRLTDRAAYWSNLDARLIREQTITHALRTPVNIIFHTLQEVNDGLAHGRFFFMDVARDGIAVYQSSDSDLHEPKPKTPNQILTTAQEYFDEWFSASMRRYEFARFGIEKGHTKETAFELHQTVESLYHTLLLVRTFYTPHVHNLGFLRTQAERIDRRLVDIWPTAHRRERAMFEKLKEAYVKARYSRHYKISEEELRWLGGRVEELGRVVHELCVERLAELRAAVENTRSSTD